MRHSDFLDSSSYCAPQASICQHVTLIRDRHLALPVHTRQLSVVARLCEAIVASNGQSPVSFPGQHVWCPAYSCSTHGGTCKVTGPTVNPPERGPAPLSAGWEMFLRHFEFPSLPTQSNHHCGYLLPHRWQNSFAVLRSDSGAPRSGPTERLARAGKTAKREKHL
jgi:hypothetical protein